VTLTPVESGTIPEQPGAPPEPRRAADVSATPDQPAGDAYWSIDACGWVSSEGC
jgi:hypothetical protein